MALSGGVDSAAVLAALCAVGRRDVGVVSYTPSTHESTDFIMAKQTAANLGLLFHAAVVSMDAELLEQRARMVISTGYATKVEVESLAPFIDIVAVASEQQHSRVLLTGDQSDGYFCLSKWAAHNFDRSQGVPFRERSRNVKQDTSPARIDAIRKRYYELDLSCSAGVRVLVEDLGMQACFPFRDAVIRRAFAGTLWSEINEPRIKEPIRLAWADWFTEDRILTRPTQVNLHKGDSLFGDTLSRTLMAQSHLQGDWSTPRGLYSAMARGEV